MAYDLNNCTFTGRLSGAPRFCTSANGVSYTRFYIRCVTSRYDSASRKYVDIPSIIPCIAFGDEARMIGQLHHDHCFEKKYIRAFRRGYRNLDVLALLTPQLVEEARTLMEGHNDHTKLVYMPNFLEHFPEEVKLQGREKTLIAVGRVAEVKRFDLLARQFVHLHPRVPDWKLRLIGDGEDLPKIRQYVSEQNAADYIELPGQMRNDQVEREMLRASLFAMSSRSEGFPFVLLEAQSCALPIVAYDVRVGPGYLVEEGKTGFLVPEGEQQTYEDRIVELMQDANRREAMGAEAMKHAQSFSRDRVAEKWFQVIG